MGISMPKQSISYWKFFLIVITGALIQCAGITNLVMPAKNDANLGAQMDAQIRANPKEYPILNDPTSRQYLQNMVNQILQSPEIKYKGTFPYKVEIIKDDKTINAFCTPGGYIYVYTGLIKMLENDASLAGVIGHEIAHAERRHSAQRMVQAYGAQTVLEIALGQNSNKTVELAANMFTGLALLKNSRSDESEADEYSFKYLQSTSWYPGAISFFFDKVKGQGGNAIEGLLSTHPQPQDRLDAVNKRVKDAKIPAPTEATLSSRTYADFKKRLP